VDSFADKVRSAMQSEGSAVDWKMSFDAVEHPGASASPSKVKSRIVFDSKDDKV
jgi:hypothetical protein